MRRGVFAAVGGFPQVALLEDLLLMKALRRSIGRPVLLPGPLLVSARRWQNNGVVRQTARNWFILSLFKLGVQPDTLAGLYRRHDAQQSGELI